MRTLFFLLLIAGTCKGYGQNVAPVDYGAIPSTNRVFFSSSGGLPISSQKYNGITSGSPYFREKWMKGTISTDDGTEYTNILLRLDLLENLLTYLDASKQEMSPVIPISKISLRDTMTGQTYVFVHSSSLSGDNSGKIWYQVVVSGKASLYKQFLKEIVEAKSYGSASTEQSIRTEEKYFVKINNSLTRVKKLKDITNQVPDKKQELSDYIDKENLNGKSESDFVALIDYYNSL
jgi:hypothetical protein